MTHPTPQDRPLRFDDRYLDEIKSRLRLSDVIGRTVKLRRQGREYVGLSPFSKERTPSFYVNDDKGFFHDFSSGKHGDLIGFLQETERLSFREAVERLAGEAGVPLPVQDPRAAEAEAQRQTLGDWLEAAAAWFEAQLRRPPGQGAREYLDRRGLPEAERARFRIGYAPAERTALKDHLIAKGARPAALVEAGLLIAPDDGAAPYDRFRDRIIFPITDGRGRVISFGGRALDPQAKAKYLNGPETPLFHKGSTLYGLAEARKLLHTGGEDAALVVVEGYMDVIACQRAGVAAVAPLGTALTEEQMAALWRLTNEPVLCFDGDAAGRRAAHRAIDRALPLLKPGRSLRFTFPVAGKDPDEILREKGAPALKAALAQTRPFVDVLFERERQAAEPLDTPERRTALKVALRKLAAAIADPDLSRAYRDDLLARFERLWTLETPALTLGQAAREMSRRRWTDKRPHADSLQRQFPGRSSLEGQQGARKLAGGPRSLVAAAVAQAVLDHPDLIDDRLEQIDVQGFCDAELDRVAQDIVHLRVQVDSLDAQTLRHHLNALGHAAKLDDIARAARKAGVSFPSAGMQIDELRALWSQAFKLLIDITALERAVVEAKADLEHDQDSTTLMRLKAERDAMKRELASGTYWNREASYTGAAVH